MSAAPGTTVDEQLGWEARWRSRAGAAAIAAGVLSLGGQVASSIALSDLPRVTIVEGLRNAIDRGAQTTVGLKAPQVVYISDHLLALVLSGVAVAVGIAALGLALVYLYQAAKFRRVETPAPSRLLAAVGAGLAAVGGLVQQVALDVNAHDFANGTDRSRDAVKDVFESPWVLGPATLQFLGTAVLGVAIIIICLNAMRSGLLTRFMGVLGMIVGGLTIFPRIAPLPVVPAFWMMALGVLILGRWPNGWPPAWETGEAHPWPTQQELREARDRERGVEPREDVVAEVDEGGDEGEAAQEQSAAHPSSKKKKRKRRN